jgi:predicted PurR-regulated permease PerM
MRAGQHIVFTFDALRRWLWAQCLDSLIMGAMWWVALAIIHVPWAPLWALFAAVFQFVPHFGPILSLMFPALAILFSDGGWTRFLELMAAYVILVGVDSLLLQPYLMKRQNRVPFWASLVVPIAMGIIIPFWGVLLAPPLLAVIYAYRERARKEQVAREASHYGIVLPPER